MFRLENDNEKYLWCDVASKTCDIGMADAIVMALRERTKPFPNEAELIAVIQREYAAHPATEHFPNGGLIPAIKAIRAVTGWGLKESKQFVDRHAPTTRS